MGRRGCPYPVVSIESDESRDWDGEPNSAVLCSSALPSLSCSLSHSLCFFLPSSNTLLADTQSLRVTVQRNYLGISDRIAEMKISHPINL